MGNAPAGAAPVWQPLSPIPKLDVERYLGDWYQIAAVPQPFNIDCARDTRANYQILGPLDIRVENTCVTYAGTVNRIVGNARVVDPVTSAQLRVSFPGVPFQDTVDGPPNYIVAHIADDYSWALVGDPLRASGFVLARSPSVTPERWAEIAATASTLGYSTCSIFTTPTSPGGAPDIRPLCVAV